MMFARRFAWSALLGLALVPVGAAVAGSPQAAGSAAGASMFSSMSNITSTGKTAKQDLGLSNLTTSGAMGNGVDTAKGTFEAKGNIQCVAGNTTYVGGVGIKITSCTMAASQPTSIGVALCDKIRTSGTPCTSNDYANSSITGTVVPGTPLPLSNYVLGMTCTGMSCGIDLVINDTLSADGPNLGQQAKQAAQQIGNSGIITTLSNVINGQQLSDAMSNEASTGTCFNNQVDQLNSTGNISNCAGTYTLQMTTANGNICSGAGGQTHWQESCTQGVPVNVSNCHTTLDCHFTQKTENVSCTTGQFTQLVFTEGQNCPYSFGVYCSPWLGSSFITGPMSAALSHGDNLMYVNGNFVRQWTSMPSVYGTCDYAGLNCTGVWKNTNCQYNYGRGTVVSFCGSQQCSQVTPVVTQEGIVGYKCDNTGTTSCPAGFTATKSGSTTTCTQNVSVPPECTYVGKQATSVSGAGSAYLNVWNCNTCGAYQSVSP